MLAQARRKRKINEEIPLNKNHGQNQRNYFGVGQLDKRVSIIGLPGLSHAASRHSSFR